MIRKCSLCWETGNIEYFDVTNFPGDFDDGAHYITHTCSIDDEHYTEVFYKNLDYDVVANIARISAKEYIDMQISVLKDFKSNLELQ